MSQRLQVRALAKDLWGESALAPGSQPLLLVLGHILMIGGERTWWTVIRNNKRNETVPSKFTSKTASGAFRGMELSNHLQKQGCFSKPGSPKTGSFPFGFPSKRVQYLQTLKNPPPAETRLLRRHCVHRQREGLPHPAGAVGEGPLSRYLANRIPDLLFFLFWYSSGG